MKKLLLAVVLAFALLVTFAACTADDADQNNSTDATTTEEATLPECDISFTVAQAADEAQKFSVSWEDDCITKLDITVKHGDSITSTAVVEDIKKTDKKSVELDAYYGTHTVEIKVTDTDGKVSLAKETVNINASEYVVAPVAGSMPQLYFTLYMNEINNNGTIPTFVWLSRPGSWNWDKLPENVYAVPTVDRAEVLKHGNYHKMVAVMDAYIEELYAANPNAKFHIYINDYNADLYLKLMAGNGIPEENYTATLLSDGGASYVEFNNAFNSDDASFDADAKYATMAQELEALYEDVRRTGDYTSSDDYAINMSKIRQYAYVMAKEMDNVDWWLLRPRKDPMLSPDEEFLNTVLGVDTTKEPGERGTNVIVERNFSSPLLDLTEEEEAALKALYNFGDEMFEAAEQQNKKAMMILGSWAFRSEPDFEAYVKLVKAYFGDEFVYFYKGHPNTPTSMYPNKAEQLKTLGLVDVESSINAELILFYYPEVYVCGYDSSTFMSVETDNQACAIFNSTIEGLSEKNYCDRVGVFFSKITDTSAYSECTDNTHEYFLIEYNRETSEYQYSIFDATTETIINGPKKAA